MQTGSQWSHKEGNSPASKYSITTNDLLTNSNIADKARQGIYSSSPAVAFFYIDKPEVIDYGYLNGHADNCAYTPVVDNEYADEAGNYYDTGIFIGSTKINDCVTFKGRMDYVSDADYLYFRASETDYYDIFLFNLSNACSLSVTLYDENLYVIEQKSNISSSSVISADLDEDKEYLLVISSDLSAYNTNVNYKIQLFD